MTNTRPPRVATAETTCTGVALARAGKLGQELDQALRERLAMIGQRTRLATGRARRADRRAEFHQRLIEIARGLLGDERPSLRPDLGFERRLVGITAQRKQSRKDADHVAVDQRLGVAVGNAGDRPRGVRADARAAPGAR